MSEDLEIFSVLDPDEPTGGFRRFGSYGGELVLITEYNCDNKDIRELIATNIVEVSSLLTDGGIFELRKVESKDNITNIILYPEGGFLPQLLFSDIPIGWYFRLKIALDIARALGALHDVNYVHNDLRSSVLGLDCEWHCRFLELPHIQKLSDILDPENKTITIPSDQRYYAPEVILHSKCSSASDMYSFGLILFEICARVAAFSITRHEETQVVDIDELLDCLPQSTPESLQQLIRQLLCPEPEYRPTVEDTIDWLDSLMMETSTVDDPGEPPLPPLPFSQRRKSSRHTSLKGTGGKGTTTIGISPKDADRLRALAEETRFHQNQNYDNDNDNDYDYDNNNNSNNNNNKLKHSSLSPQSNIISPVPTNQRFFVPQPCSDDNSVNEEEIRSSIVARGKDTVVAALGRNAVIGQRDFYESESDLRAYLSLKAHNLPIYKNKYFFFKDANLVWCSDKKLVDRPDRLHYFDLTIATMEETGPLQIQITRIGDIDPLSPSHLKPTKSYLFGTTKERNHLQLKFPSADVAKEWKNRLKKEISHARCQMCLCKVVMTPDQIFQREKFRYQSQENTPGLQYPELAFFCSEQCAKFRSAVHNKGLNVGTTTSTGGSQQLKLTEVDIQSIDKRLISKRNPATWKRLSLKHGLTASALQSELKNLELNQLPTSIEDWLESINENGLIGLFKEKHYEIIEHIMIVGLNHDDMNYLGITSTEKIKILLDASNKLTQEYLQYKINRIKSENVLVH